MVVEYLHENIGLAQSVGRAQLSIVTEVTLVSRVVDSLR